MSCWKEFAPSLRPNLAQAESMSIQVSLVDKAVGRDHELTCKVATQIQEMQMVREKVYAMEQTHLALKQKCVPRIVSKLHANSCIDTTRRLPVYIVSLKLEELTLALQAAHHKMLVHLNRPLLRSVMARATSLVV